MFDVMDCKSMDYFLYDRELCHKRVKQKLGKKAIIYCNIFPGLNPCCMNYHIIPTLPEKQHVSF